MRGAVALASMRPRELPAEDVKSMAQSGLPAGRASMRPRELPAEDGAALLGPAPNERASMRPRELPAEDSRSSGAARRCRRGFNEAAGVTRGRLKTTCSMATTPPQLQ